MIHELKTVNPHFIQVWAGKKKFEIRYDDRGFKTGHILILKEYFAVSNSFSGRQIKCLVSHVLREYDGLKEGYVILSIEALKTENLKGAKL